MSDRKSRQMISKAKSLNSDAVIVAVGCYVQTSKEEIEKNEDIDIAIGNANKNSVLNEIEKYFEKREKIVDISNIMQERKYMEYNEKTFIDKARVEIKIQDGCDRFCSYCEIPYARGPVRSRNINNIIDEVKYITKTSDKKEVVITGIHIASYGKDLKDDIKLIDVLERINEIEGIERIRLGSLEPTIITKEFLDRLIKIDKICHHFHLSLQSGCDDTLKRMNRRYTTKEFLESVNLLRKYYTDVALTTDVIVGFPGETEDEFEKTYKFLEDISFSKMHIFKYSNRKGTVADKLPNQVNGEIKNIRSKKLIEMSTKNEIEFAKQYIGKVVDVLFEQEDNEISVGHTSNYIVVKVNKINLENTIKKVEITGIDDKGELFGIICE